MARMSVYNTAARDWMTREPTWMMFECTGGARFTSVLFDDDGESCSFSGCTCNGTVRKVGTTTDPDEASAWFRRP